MNQIAPGVFRVDGPELRMPAGVVMPLSTTVLKLDDGSLAVYSPCALTDEQAGDIERAGEVAHVVAPNLLHYLYAGAAKARWPRATLWAPPALVEKARLADARNIAEL